jgi:O-succinylbenzoic acid--CoA ligase
VHERLGVDPAVDRWLACLPLNHLGGFGVVARAVLTGTPLTVAPSVDGAVIAEAADHGCTLTSLVPAVLDRIEVARWRWIVLGGSADPASRPANVVRTYGLTESGGGVVYDGRPLTGTEVRVVDGRIELRGPTIARGVRAPDGTVTTLVDADGWLATGDLGRLHDGALVVLGRSDDLIVTGGENVWPEPVEAVLRTHPAVADAAVVGATDERWGERVVAVVVPTDPSSPPRLGDLRDHVRATLPASAAPWELRLVSALPRTALGKVRRAELRAQ